MQEALSLGESYLGGLKKNLESEQAEHAKAESNLKSSLEDLEKVKANFNAERSALETEKAALLKRAKDTENQLKPVVVELVGLKHHISQMTTTIFDKWDFQLIKITRPVI